MTTAVRTSAAKAATLTASASDGAMNLPVPIGSVVNDRYVVERVLGEGGMGVVVLAKHRVLDQKVAIKFLRRGPATEQNAVQRFVREAQAAAKITSEFVVRVHDVAVLADGTPYIVMEYLEGVTLSVMLGSGQIAVRDALRFATQMCEALAETHAAGIAHGDLKPENVYIAGAGEARRVKLLDFGVSKIAFEDPTSSAVVMGTPAYMAPEQIDQGVVAPRTDIWAFGTVLYEMLSGQLAFGGGSADEVRSQMQRGPAPIVRADLPPGLEPVIRRCLATDPSRRFADALELAKALEPYMPAESSVQRIGQISVPVVTRGVRGNARRHAATVVVNDRKRGYGAWILAGLAAVAIAGLVLILMAVRHRGSRGAYVPASAPPPVSVAVEPPAPPPSASVSTPVVASVVPAKPHPRPAAPRPKTAPPAVGEERFGTRK